MVQDTPDLTCQNYYCHILPVRRFVLYVLLHLPPAFYFTSAMQERKQLIQQEFPKVPPPHKNLLNTPEATSIPQERFLPVKTLTESENPGKIPEN